MLSLAALRKATRHAKTTATLLALITCLAQSALADKIKPPKLPATLGNDGLVFMQLGPQAWEDAVVKLSNGKRAAAVDGYFVFKLAPGKYRVTNVSVTTTLGTKVTEKLKLGLEFEIRPGKVTSLGMQYLIADPGNPGRYTEQQYAVLPLGNPGAERAFLQHYYPRLAANLADDAIEMAPYDYKNNSLPEIRRMLLRFYAKKAYKAMENGDEQRRFGVLPIVVTDSLMIVGDLGLVAFNNGGELEIADTGTVERIDQVKFTGGQPWFFSRAGHLYRLQDKKLETMPRQDFYPISAARWGDRIVLSDRHLRLLVSTDNGASWSQDNGVAVADSESLRSDFTLGSGRLFVLAQDPKFVFRLMPHAVLEPGSGAAVSWTLPKDMGKNFQRLLENDAGLFVHTQRYKKPAYLHFKPTGSDQWRTRLITEEPHCKVAFADVSGAKLSARCGATVLVSDDNGESWKSLSKAAFTAK